MKSAKEKLDEKLGIKDIGDIFNQEDIDAILRDSKIEIQNIEKKIKNSVETIDKTVEESKELIKKEEYLPTQMKVYNLEESLGEISYLVNKSKDIISNLYNYITKTDFVDPDIISSTAKMIEASRIVISDYIELYKEKLRMMHSINLEMQRHHNRMELEEHKAMLKKKYAITESDEKHESLDLVPYVQEQVIHAINTCRK